MKEKTDFRTALLNTIKEGIEGGPLIEIDDEFKATFDNREQMIEYLRWAIEEGYFIHGYSERNGQMIPAIKATNKLIQFFLEQTEN